MFHGSMAALITPFMDDQQVDYAALAELIAWHIKEGTDGLVVLGTTGESPTITHSERNKLVQFVLAEVNERLPVIIGTGTNATAQSIEYTEQAMALGANAALVVTPYYNKPTQEGLYQHFAAVAKSSPLPIILYNVPGRTGCDLHNDTVARLADMPNIIGLKDATADLSRADDFVARGLEMDLYSGDDATAMQLMLKGGKGVISVVANVAPAKMAQLAKAALAGDSATAESINTELTALYQASVCESNPIPTKWMLKQLGMIQPNLRLPLTPLSEAHHTAALAAMQHAGVLSAEKSE